MFMHHSLFFDVPFEQHAKKFMMIHNGRPNPLFYVSVTSETDDQLRPQVVKIWFSYTGCIRS